MSVLPFPLLGQIDAVITWVNGADPLHKFKRESYLAPASSVLHENGINPHRWACNDELGYCLRSIGNNAPWIRRIWIVTDDQSPDLSGIGFDLLSKIELVDHRVLFDGYAGALPTFNSLAIESMIWRIPGLSERFMYFNDDVFLTAPLQPDDVFRGAVPVLRGKWVDYSALAANPAQQSDPALFNHYTQINAAAMEQFGAAQLFASAHVVHPMCRSVFAQLFEDHEAAFIENIRHRFRDVGQFLPQGLHNHACIKAGACVVQTADDHLHLRTGALMDYSLEDVRSYLRRALLPEMKFLCVNDICQVEAAIPDARDWIERAISV
jgi:Stealth protein CR2, conserved region 2/Stealth protein CR1, conserved region 1